VLKQSLKSTSEERNKNNEKRAILVKQSADHLEAYNVDFAASTVKLAKCNEELV
jgi:hypothetical protein